MRVYLCPKKDNDVKAQIEKLKELAPLDPNAEFPAISVIVPLYNVEKYVGECLDSLLAQTFKNFEIIIVDDCSTDNSVDVVNEYAPKFDGRLILVHMEENSGYAGFPRNKGIELARGEYVYFVDPDDTITPTALEELYTAAKYYNADVVHCEKYYSVPDEFYNDAEYRKTLKPYSWPTIDKIFITQPTMLTNDFEKRVKDFSQGWLSWASWQQFIRRDFLLDNRIYFPNTYSQDLVFTISEICCAKNYLVVPNVVYYWRLRSDSRTREELDASQTIHRYTSVLKQGISYLDEFLNRREFFVNRADLKYALFDILAFPILSPRLNEVYKEIPAYELNELLQKEFGDDAAVKAYFFNKMNLYRLGLNPPQESITEPAVEVLPESDEVKDFTPKVFPAISVIIPMYNVEKYVAECLDSLLAQTFQSFEVIVVDDCSTDSSRSVVESYLEKFDGRLTLVQLEENSGGAGFPRNKGIELARGEYLSFIDPDDTIAPNAFEELYKTAKKYDTDVIQCEKWYQIREEFYHDAEHRKNVKPTGWPTKEKIYITQSTMLTKDFEKRIIDFGKMWLPWSVCLQFIRRDFVVNNGIRFLHTYAEDLLFTMCELSCAKNYLLVPNVFYFYRLRESSSTKVALNVSQAIHRYVSVIKYGIDYLEEFLNRQEFFAERPDLKYALLDNFVCEILGALNKVYHEVPVHTFDEHLRKEFNSDSAFTAFLFNVMNVYRLKLNPSPRRIVVPEINLDRIGDREYDFLSKKNPAVSVIIPLYNSEKYIGELLDSLLAQTFQSFEVIVVDDCSTDLSAAVVKIYAARFDGRLRLVKTKKNTGSPGDPGNLGVSLSHGKYLFILDNDDAITPDAIEKLYNVAEDFDADVVACEKYYKVPEESWYDSEFRKNLKPFSYKKGDFVDKPTLISFDVAKRVRDCYERKFLWTLWSKLIRRDAITENEIHFTNNLIQDFLATSCLIYTAKRFVRVPYAVNYYRVQNSSLYYRERDPLEKMKIYLSCLHVGFSYLDNFLSKIEFFQQNPESKQLALKTYFNETWGMYIRPVYNKIPIHDREDALRKEFTGSDNTALITLLFNELGTTGLTSNFDLTKYIPSPVARLDIKFVPKLDGGNFKIVSVSDAKAELRKPEWLNNGGNVGYLIQSRNSHLEIVAKATTEGKVCLDLRGLSIPDPKDANKRLPYWVEYKNLTVNGKTLFNTSTLAWHDKPYRYELDVRAGKEIEIQIDWLPKIKTEWFTQTSNVLALPPPVQKKEEPIVDKKCSEVQAAQVSKKLDEQSSLISELRVALDNEKKIHNRNVELISRFKNHLKTQDDNAKVIEKFKNYLTARADVKLIPEGEGDFQVVSISDEDAALRKANWLPKTEIGYSVQSYVGNMKMVVKPTANGQLFLDLKSVNARDPISKKRVPYWIDYTKLIVNGEIIFDKLTPAWHEKPYTYMMTATADEEVTIIFEWFPHKSDEVDISTSSKVKAQEIKTQDNNTEVIKKFKNYLTARADVKLIPEGEGDFKIVSLTDKDATLRKAAWLPESETGYSVQSYVGNMKMVVKPTANGQLVLDLKSVNARDPISKKRVPYWIDYTKLIVNGEIIFDKLTPAWHEKPYTYMMTATADEEVTIIFEWLPHRSDT